MANQHETDNELNQQMPSGKPLPGPHGSAPTRDPRNYVYAGARRLAMRKKEWLEDWWISHSPRNNNQNAEGTWEEWVSLANAILKADTEWKAQNNKVSDPAGSVMTWNKTSDRLPTTENCGQVNVIMWSPGWATWLKGMFTFWQDEPPEWSLYNQQTDRYEAMGDPLPEYWCAPVLPLTKVSDAPDSAAPNRESTL